MRTYSIVKNGLKADIDSGRAEFYVTIVDPDQGIVRCSPYVPMETHDLVEARLLLSRQVMNSFARLHLLAEEGEIATLVRSIENLLLRDHPRFFVSLASAVVKAIGGEVTMTTTELPQDNKLRVLFSVETGNGFEAPFAGVDVRLADPRSIVAAKETLIAQVASFAAAKRLDDEQRGFLTDFVLARLEPVRV